MWLRSHCNSLTLLGAPTGATVYEPQLANILCTSQ